MATGPRPAAKDLQGLERGVSAVKVVVVDIVRALVDDLVEGDVLVVVFALLAGRFEVTVAPPFVEAEGTAAGTTRTFGLAIDQTHVSDGLQAVRYPIVSTSLFNQ
eukprot:scaffold216377_cov26-Prasinocladus_malaysianus.AAC.2